MVGHRHRRRDPRRVRRVVIVVALASAWGLVAGACGDDDTAGIDAADVADEADGADVADAERDGEGEAGADDEGDHEEGDDDEGDHEEGDGDEGEAGTEPELTASWRGVTPEAITIGVSLLDFDILKELNLSPNGWGDQIAVWQALIDEVNAGGGINGRDLEAVFDFYSPIDATDAERACTTLTQNHEVFAVLGGFLGPLAGTADPCIVGINETILVGGEQTPDEVAQATAPWYTAGSSTDGRIANLLDLLVETGRADGAKVFVVSAASAAGDLDVVLDGLEARDIELVGSDSLVANDGDTVTQDAELRVIMELVRQRGATAVLINGNPSAPIRGIGAAGLAGEIDIWSTDPGALGNLGATITDKSIANGTLAAIGRDQSETWALPTFQSECVDVVKAAIPGVDLRDPTTYAETDDNWYNPTNQACAAISLFVEIATAAGPELTHDSFVAGAESLTDFALPGSGSNSLGPGKITAQDEVRLGEFDHTQGGDGGLVPVTELVDLYP